jgi:cysteinyl-tRNA synthetase
MSKSLGNTYTAEDVVKKGFDPMSLRYLYLQTHYRQEMNFTWDALTASQTALNKLRRHYLESGSGEIILPGEFEDAINEDLNLPRALSVVWENIDGLNHETLDMIDSVLGLQLSSYKEEEIEIPEDIQNLANKREELRKAGNYGEADKIRGEIEGLGYQIEDTGTGIKVSKSVKMD